MFKKLIEISKRPKRTATRKNLIFLFGYQLVCLLVISLVVAFWPERIHAAGVGILLFMCISFTLMLLLETLEHRLGAADDPSQSLTNDGKDGV